jgi:small-conductance mechanosensitive channel
MGDLAKEFAQFKADTKHEVCGMKMEIDELNERVSGGKRKIDELNQRVSDIHRKNLRLNSIEANFSEQQRQIAALINFTQQQNEVIFKVVAYLQTPKQITDYAPPVEVTPVSVERDAVSDELPYLDKDTVKSVLELLSDLTDAQKLSVLS